MEDVGLARNKLLRHRPDGILDFSHWRVASSFDLCVSGYYVESASHPNEVPNGNLSLFSHGGAQQAWHKFLRFKPGNKVSSISDSCEAANSIVTFARLDAFVAATIT